MFTNIGFYQGTGQVKVLCGVMHAQQLFSVVIGQVAHWPWCSFNAPCEATICSFSAMNSLEKSCACRTKLRWAECRQTGNLLHTTRNLAGQCQVHY